MNKFTKAIAAIMLIVAAIIVAGCNKCDVSGSFNGHDYVDLGLPSGTLWATCNIGASKPDGYGDYYAWGETSIYTGKYKFFDSVGGYTKYCTMSSKGFADSLTELQANDDPATANWGSGWQTPSKVQWDELLDNTTGNWRIGLKGCVFKSKRNGRSIFFPAAGIYSYYNGVLWDIDTSGYYWSRSLYSDYNPWYLNLSVRRYRCFMSRGDMERYHGCSVRPVCSASQN